MRPPSAPPAARGSARRSPVARAPRPWAGDSATDLEAVADGARRSLEGRDLRRLEALLDAGALRGAREGRSIDHRFLHGAAGIEGHLHVALARDAAGTLAACKDSVDDVEGRARRRGVERL